MIDVSESEILFPRNWYKKQRREVFMMQKIIFNRLIMRWDETEDKCPRIGAWLAWDHIVFIGFVINLGVKRFGIWLSKHKVIEGRDAA